MVQSDRGQTAPKCCFKNWCGVLCLLMLLSTVKCEPMTLQELERVVSSHNQSFMKINSYLTNVDKFYHWYSATHRRLEQLLRGASVDSVSGGATTPSGGDEGINGLTNRLQLLENASRTQDQKLVQQREQQTLHLSTLEAQLKELEEQLRQKDAQIEELKNAVTSNNTINNLAMFIRQMAAKSNSSIQELAANLTQVAENVSQSNAQVERMVSESVRAMFSRLETRIQATEDAKNLSLENTLHHDATINSMQTELQLVINKTDHYDAWLEALNNLQSKAEQFEAGRREDKSAVNMMERSLRGEMSAIGESVNQSASRTEEVINKINQSMSEVKGIILQSTTEHTTLSNKVNNIEKGSQSLNVRFESVQESLQMLGTKTNGLDTTIGSLQGSLSRLQSRVDGIEQGTRTLQLLVNTLTAKVEDLTGQVKTVGERSAASAASDSAVQEIRNKLQELERKVNEKSSVREKGNELLNRIAGGGRGAAGAVPHPSTLGLGG